MKAIAPRVARTILFFAVFVDMIGYGIVVPLLPLYTAQFQNGALMVGVLSAWYAGLQAVAGPLLVGLSDRYGRRRLLLFSLAGTMSGYLLLAMADSLPLLLLALTVDALTGGNQSLAQAIVADTTEPAERTAGFGVLNAAFGLGFVAGPLLGGWLSSYGLAWPAIVAAALAASNLLFALVALRETLMQEQRLLSPLVSLNPLSQLWAIIRLVAVRRLLGLIFLANLTFAGLQSNFPIFAQQRWLWDAPTIAWFFGLIGAMAVATQAVLLGQLRRYWSEPRLIRAGLLFAALGLFGIGLAAYTWQLVVAALLAAFGINLVIPALGGLVSQRVPAERQGQLMGALQIVINAALVAGPLLAGASFDLFGAAAPYLLAGLVALAASLVVLQSPSSVAA